MKDYPHVVCEVGKVGEDGGCTGVDRLWWLMVWWLVLVMVMLWLLLVMWLVSMVVVVEGMSACSHYSIHCSARKPHHSNTHDSIHHSFLHSRAVWAEHMILKNKQTQNIIQRV